MAENEFEIEARVEHTEQPTNAENIFARTLSENERPSVKNASKAVRRKLYFLFALLALVIVLMKEAKKPERWEWMGFDKQPASQPIILDPDQDLSSPLPAEKAGDQNGFQQPQELKATSENVTSLTELQAEFIEQVWDDSDTTRQFELADLVTRCAWSSGAQDPVSGKSEPLAEMLRQFITSQHDDVAISTVDEADRIAQRKVIDELAALWNEKLIPAFDSVSNGKDITMAQQLAARKSLPVFQRLANEQLEDLTTVGRKSELPAWLMFWRRVAWQTLTDEAAPKSVSTVELRAQPRAWRGKPVSIRGSLLAGRKVKLESKLALENGYYFEWWIADRHGKGEIYCLYSEQQPEAIAVGEKLVACRLGLGALAYSIALMVDRQDRDKPPGPRGKMLESINENLGELSEDPSIKTTAEQMRELEDES